MPARQHADRRVQSGHWPAAVGHQRDREQHEQGRRRAARRTGFCCCPWSSATGPARVATGWCRAAASTGSNPSAGSSARPVARSSNPDRRLRTASCRARPSGTRSVPSTSATAMPANPPIPIVDHCEQPAAEDVQRDLHAIHQVHDQRGAEPVLGDVARHRHDPLGARALAPLGHVDDGQVGLDEPHCSSFGKPRKKLPAPTAVRSHMTHTDNAHWRDEPARGRRLLGNPLRHAIRQAGGFSRLDRAGAKPGDSSSRKGSSARTASRSANIASNDCRVFSRTDSTQFSVDTFSGFGCRSVCRSLVHPLGTGDKCRPDAPHQRHRHVGFAGHPAADGPAAPAQQTVTSDQALVNVVATDSRPTGTIG